MSVRIWEQWQAVAVLPSEVHWSPFPRTSSLLRTCKRLQAPELCAEKQASAPDSAADLLGDARRVAHSLTQPPLDFLVLQKRNRGLRSGTSSPKQRSSPSPRHPLVCAEIATFPKEWWFLFDHWVVPQLKYHKWLVSPHPAVQRARGCPGVLPKPPILINGIKDSRAKHGTLRTFLQGRI